MKHLENLVVIHLSATAVYAVIGQVVSAKDIRIMGVSQIKNSDFIQGQIIHRDRLKSAIKNAIAEAEDMANCRVHSVLLSISTPELVSKNGLGKTKTSDGIVQIKDIVQALALAKSENMPNNYYLMHHCQQGIVLDSSRSLVDDAIGMYAQEVAVMYHLMTVPVISFQNIQSLLQECDVTIDHVLFDAVSSAEYSLIDEEREQGVCLIDMGASTTSICVYKENKLIFTSCVDDGGYSVTADIASELGITISEAEELKKRYGTVDIHTIDPAKFFVYKRHNGESLTISLYTLAQIIEARYIEIFTRVFQQLNKAGLMDYLERGVVLDGGASLINGMIPFSKRLLNMPVVLTNQNTAIRVFDGFDTDEKTEMLNAKIQDRVFHTAFGALLYSQTDQFYYSEKSLSEPEEINLLKDWVLKVSDFLKKWI